MEAPLPANEAQRLEALDRYKVLDTPREREFDDLVRLAAQLTQTPISLVSLVDRDRQWFKGRYGLEVAETTRRLAFCSHTILHPDQLMEVPDATQDQRFANNELVTGPIQLRYYLGAPLVTPDGYALGTLCVLDRQPRQLTSEQKDALSVLARQVMTQLELRRQTRRSEALYRTMAQSIPDAALSVVDPELRYLAADGQLLPRLGLGRSDLEGRPVEEVYGGDLGRERAALFRRALNGEIATNETEYRGRTLWTQFSPLRDAQGHTFAAMSLVLDITERKQAECALQESEERFRVLFETSPISTFLIDFETRRILDCNDQAALALGYSRAQLCQLLLADIDAQLTPEQIAANLTRLAHGDHLRFETLHRTRTGELRNVLVSTRGLSLGGRLVDYASSVDITERKQAEQALQTAKEDLARTNANLDRLIADRTAELRESVQELEHFSYALMHDMRAPLRAMIGFAELIEAECRPCRQPQVIDYLRQIQSASNRLDHLIRDALDFTSVLRRDVRLCPVALLPLLKSLLGTYPELWPHQPQIHLAPDLPSLLGNEAALTECFANLLRNAVKFVKPGTTPRVRVWAEPKGEVARIWVEDNGIGIPRESQQRIFTMFQRLHSAKDYPGTGIGLAIVKKSIERIGGRVGVESEVDKGSRFWVELPRAESQVTVAAAA